MVSRSGRKGKASMKRIYFSLVLLLFAAAGGAARAGGMHDAAGKGDAALLSHLLDEYPELVEAKNSDGDRPLHAAVMNGRQKTAELLVGRGADVNAEGRYGLSAVKLAIALGRFDLADTLLTTEARIGAVEAAALGRLDWLEKMFGENPLLASVGNDFGETPLHHAALRGRKEAVDFLLKQGADVNASTTGAPGYSSRSGRETPLHWAARGGSEEVTVALIEWGTSIDKLNDAGRTPLFLAAEGGHAKIVWYLIEAGADPTRVDSSGSTPLHLASNAGVAEILLRREIDVDARDGEGMTALTRAVGSERFRLSTLLKHHGARTSIWDEAALGMINEIEKRISLNSALANARDKSGYTPLHYAAREGRAKLAEYLIGAGADPNASTNKDGSRPLHLAVRRDHVAVVRTLLNKGADVNAKDGEGSSALHYAAMLGDPDAVSLLLKRGADPQAKDGQGRTAAHYAAARDKLILAAILDKGGKPGGKDQSGAEPIHYAAARGNAETVKLLLARGADINARDGNGLTPFAGYVDYNGCPDLAFYLLDSGADLEAKDGEGRTPLHIKAFKGDAASVKFLLKRGARIDAKDKKGFTPLHHACFQGRYDCALLLLNEGARIDARSISGATPLFSAAWTGKRGLARLLIKRGADPDARNEAGASALSAAAWTGQLRTLQFLIEAGADLSRPDYRGSTPLHAVALPISREWVGLIRSMGESAYQMEDPQGTDEEVTFSGQESVARFLLDSGFEVDVKNKKGMTPLHQAAYFGNKRMAEFFIGEGAKINERDDYYVTPLGYATLHKHSDVASLLKENKGKLLW